MARSASFSYYRGQSSGQPAKPTRPKRDLGWLRMLPSLLAIAICGMVFIYGLYITPQASLKLEGTNYYRSEEEYRTGIRKILSSSILNRSKITLNSDGIERKILETYPELAAASIAIPLAGHTPVVGIKFSEPSLKFVSAGKQMVLDTSGKVLPLEAVNAVLPTVTDDSGIQYEIGDRALTTEEVAILNFTAEEAKANNRKIVSLKIGTAPKEFQLQLEGDAFFAKLSFDTPIRQQLGALWAVLERLGGNVPKTYIDVRLGERAFVL